MRDSRVWGMLALVSAVSVTACADMSKLQKEVQAGVKQAQTIQKSVDAAKKGDLGGAQDAALSSSVKAALEKDAKTRGTGIEVEAKGGVVHLKGSVAADVKAEAEKIAKGIPGVSKVSNELKGGKVAVADKADKKDAPADKQDAPADKKDAKMTRSAPTAAAPAGAAPTAAPSRAGK